MAGCIRFGLAAPQQLLTTFQDSGCEEDPTLFPSASTVTDTKASLRGGGTSSAARKSLTGEQRKGHHTLRAQPSGLYLIPRVISHPAPFTLPGLPEGYLLCHSFFFFSLSSKCLGLFLDFIPETRDTRYIQASA